MEIITRYATKCLEYIQTIRISDVVDMAIIAYVIYRLLRWPLGLGNFFLVLLLSICLGGACFGLGWLFSPLYAVHFDPQEFLDRSLIQALYLPVAWLLLTATRPLACSHDEE